jgi:hypothetical protein
MLSITPGLVDADAASTTLAKELDWMEKVLNLRSQLNCNSPASHKSLYDLSPPSLDNDRSPYANIVRTHNFGFEERITLIMALAPHLKPKTLDVFKHDSKHPTAYGGYYGKQHRGFIPTGETVLFVLAGSDVVSRLRLLYLFDSKHAFVCEHMLWLEDAGPHEPKLSGVLAVSHELLDLVIHGQLRKPDFGPEFPAKLLTTQMQWDDLVVTSQTMAGIMEIESWITHNRALMQEWEMSRKLKPGYRALFYGPPGTGKTLTATLIGKRTERDVFRIDLSTVVSKYIGETEKNLSKLFDRAEHKEWILFFDEADALFGKRTNVNDANDRYANQETAYLLQRIEDYNGLVVLASNHKQNIDSAFMRRFQSIVYFPMPQYEERIQLWRKGFSPKAQLDPGIDLNQLAKQYELSGGPIMNIIQYSSLKALVRGSNVITYPDLLEGLKRELSKENRTI